MKARPESPSPAPGPEPGAAASGPDTPLMRQYARVKAEHRDKILLFRMGDFYEMFFEDALTASRVLDIALTSREKGPGAVPMAGVPWHAAEGYIAYIRGKITDNRAAFQLSDAQALPVETAAYDAVVSGLALNFVQHPDQAVTEMARAASPGGLVAAYVWDYAGKMQFLR